MNEIIPHKIVIKPKRGCNDEITHPANTEVWMDDKKLRLVQSIAFEIDVNGLTRIKIGMIGQVSLKGKYNLKKEKFCKIKGWFKKLRLKIKKLRRKCRRRR